MKTQQRQSFFQRLTGSFKDDEDDNEAIYKMENASKQSMNKISKDRSGENDEEDYVHDEDYTSEEYIHDEEPMSADGQLALDIFETEFDVIVKTMIPGVRKDEVEISLSRDLLTIRGERKDEKTIPDNAYHYRELYWGTFSRTIRLPHEVDIDRAEANESQGMLTLKLPRIDKERQAKLKVR